MRYPILNIVNAGLIVLSGLLALRFPLETFLSAYAFLGPLHYLTEVSWLHERHYFMHERKRAWIFVALTFVAFPLSMIVFRSLGGYVATMLAFFGSILLLREKITWKDGAVLALIAGLLTTAFSSPTLAFWLITISILVPTVIHVFLFTGLFMVAGALREDGRSGWMVFASFFLMAVGLMISGEHASTWGISSSLRPLYAGFSRVNEVLLWLSGHQGAVDIWTSPLALGIMRFLAFAYLYHYLNWFSKTSVIGWHHVARFRAYAIVAAWLSTMAIYLYNYRLGLFVMLFLSVLHVFLEFPLNWRTIGRLAVALSKRARFDIARMGL